MNALKTKNLLTAGVLALTTLLSSSAVNAGFVTGTATFTIDNAAVQGTNANNWFFETHWGPSDNTLAINGSTAGGTTLPALGSYSFQAPVNTNTTTTNYIAADRTLQATTMDTSDTSLGQIGLSGGMRMAEPTGLGGFLAPYDYSIDKTGSDWIIHSTDSGFGTVNLFQLTNVSESLNGSGELLLSGDLLWATGFGYAGVIGADTNTVIGSFSLAPSAVPVPAAVWLFGSGLLGLAGLKRKKA